jgi:hypothetical protein
VPSVELGTHLLPPHLVNSDHEQLRSFAAVPRTAISFLPALGEFRRVSPRTYRLGLGRSDIVKMA